MNGVKRSKEIEVTVEPEELCLAPAYMTSNGSLRRTGVVIGTLIANYVWMWLNTEKKHVVSGFVPQQTKVECIDGKFVITFSLDAPVSTSK